MATSFFFPLAVVFNTSPSPKGAFSFIFFSSVVFYSSSTSLVSQISQYMYVLSLILLDLFPSRFPLFSTLAGATILLSLLLP